MNENSATCVGENVGKERTAAVALSPRGRRVPRGLRILGHEKSVAQGFRNKVCVLVERGNARGEKEHLIIRTPRRASG